ncbi:nucleoside triphosphate pyrophosphohydrolase [Oceaniserpentilla sp. 4NH20-0058]|uniref:nucleoside triphosphate pyrophosphohydrolase n=1 Tax=Oceaniserpentilla sp. 4NH20-0058 TaxID=3127660 RepID=UPI003104671B
MHQLDDLLYLMARLRDPQTGCPWDLKQTFTSILPHTLEEAYEVADAIEQNDLPHLKEELGDLLFQVIFYSQLGKEQNVFNFHDIIDTLVTKLVRRHPHVFPSGELRSEANEEPLSDEQIKGRWEATKQQERAEKAKQLAKQGKTEATSILDDVPLAFPAIQRAEKLQKRAATVGFDWPEPEQVLDKIEEEIQELREAMASGQHAQIEDELGDLFFAMVNLARHVKVKPEMALRSTNNKFERRFKYIESCLALQNKQLQDASLDEMETLWQQAKQLEK